MSNILLPILLSLFDGGTAAGTAGEGAGAQGETKGSSGNTRRGKSGETILYGKQPSVAKEDSTDSGTPVAGEEKEPEVQTTSNTLEDRKKAYFEFVNSEDYKDIYAQEQQRMLNKRFKEVKGLETSLEAQKPILDMLMSRYKIADGDMGKLQAALEKDHSYWEQAAEEAGLTVEQYQDMQRLQRENAELKAMKQQKQASEAAQQQVNRWMQESEGLKSVYKNFDLRTELNNPQFLSMLKSGVPVKSAYEVVHMEDIKAGIAQMTAKATEKQVTDNIRAKGQRPPENGTSAQSAFTVKDDVSKLSRKDRAEIARRVARGETIAF